MKWEMEIEEIETVLEKIWDLHDKLSDAIHSISRAHFLSSIKAQRRSHRRFSAAANDAASDDNRAGFVFVKDFRVDADDDSAIQEAKSLNAIRTALENLEDQLEIFHTVQVQQRAERDAAISRLEQSRIVLAMRLAEHHGKKYKVIEEALAFVGEVKESNRFVTPEKLYGDSPSSSSGENLATTTHERNRPWFLHNVLLSSLGLAKRALKLDFLGGVLGNAAMVAISMVAMVHLQQAANSRQQQGIVLSNRRVQKTAQLQESSSDDCSSNLDVLLARG